MTATKPSETTWHLKDELQAVLDQMARVYVARDAAACAAIFTGDAALYSPYAPPARGRTEIEALHRIWTPSATTKRFEVFDCGANGGLAWVLARFWEGETGTGITLAVFEQHGQAGWLIRACSLNETKD